MKLRSTVAAIAGVVIALTGATAANADDTPKVDRYEFAHISLGQTFDKTIARFDSKGTQVETYKEGGYAHQIRAWQVTTSELGFVYLDLVKVNGVWRVNGKLAAWLDGPKQTTDKMTKAEYRSFAKGATIAEVRAIAGTAGRTQIELRDSETKTLTVEWPVPGSEYGYTSVDFTWKDGAFRVASKTAVWG
ncbi:hypothetical protein [Demequina gelatinilytica]|uniref:hypothetical protein n=1 Tax=Demequina gelatinilytica TaxID=1638980 RepID=UPI000785D2C1|nr:hypothetical protein [Demequina gelatinilytica]